MAETKQQHIVAIGGAAFRAEPENLSVDRYILNLTKKKRPTVSKRSTRS